MLPAGDRYVSPNGTPSGSGALADPYDLKSALLGVMARPGDTFWLRGGNYRIGHVDTTIAGAPGRPVTFQPMPGEKARIDGSLTFWGSPGHVVLMDVELYGSDTNRLSAQAGMGINPPPADINPIIGIACLAPNVSFINLVVHDQTRSGIYISEIATNTLVYGCVVYNNGWASPDNAEGHGLYVQSHLGGRELTDNIVFNNTGANLHIYESRAPGLLLDVTLEGNVAFNAGALQAVRRYADWIVGVDAPAVRADRIVLRSNMAYLPPNSTAQDQVQIGRDGTNGSVALLDNYMPMRLSMNNWTTATVSGNVFAAHSTSPIVLLNQTQGPLAAVWNDNKYWGLPLGTAFLSNTDRYTFSEWHQATGYDDTSTHSDEGLSGTKVFVRPNRYEAGRAHIVVYNWDGASRVPVDAGSLLPKGVRYEVFNAQDLDAPPVLNGVFEGGPLMLPMTGLSVAAPNGPLLTPPPTGPVFNVFVLRSCRSKLGITPLTDGVELSWPTNCGSQTLQVNDGLSGAGVWRDLEAAPALRAHRNVVTNAVTATNEFYRLRSR